MAGRNPIIIVVLVLLAGGAFILWRVLGDSEGKGAEEGASAVAPGGVTGADSPPPIVADGDPLPSDLRQATGSLGAGEEELPPGEASWRECLSREDAIAVRSCLEEWLPEGGLDPASLAAILCDDEGTLDEEERVLVSAAAAQWAPEELFDRAAELHGLCEDLGGFWRDFLTLQAESDPLRVEAAYASLGAPVIFDDRSSTIFAALAAERAQGGDVRLQEILALGAAGDLGGSDEQVALAISETVRLETDPAARLTRLEAVLGSPAFQGREYETDALTGALLDPRTVNTSTRDRALALTGLLLDHPRLASGAGRHLLRLNEFGVLPSVYSEEEITDLVRRATAVAPPTDEGFD